MVGSQLILTLRLWEMLPVPQIPNIRRGGAVALHILGNPDGGATKGKQHKKRTNLATCPF